MKELEQAMTAVFAKMVANGDLNQIVEESVKGAVKRVIADCFTSYSPFHKQLGEHINKTLAVDFSALGLAGYNDFLLKVIKTKLDAAVFQFAEQHISQGLDELLKPAPKEIKLSALIELLREARREDLTGEEDGISWHVRKAGTVSRYRYVHLDPKRGKSYDECGYQLSVTDQGEVYRLVLPWSGDVSKKIFAGPFYGFDRALFQMYAAKTKLILDEEAED